MSNIQERIEGMKNDNVNKIQNLERYIKFVDNIEENLKTKCEEALREMDESTKKMEGILELLFEISKNLS